MIVNSICYSDLSLVQEVAMAQIDQQYEKLVEKAREAAKRRNYDYAIDLYMQVLKLNPDHGDAAREIRQVTKRKGQEEGTSKKGGFFKGLGSFIKSKSKGITKHYDQQIEECEKFLRNAPFNVGMLISLGNAAAKAGYNQRAIANFEEVLTLDKNSLDALKALGRLHKMLGEYAKAQSYYLKVSQVSPHDVEASRSLKDIAAATTADKIGALGDDYRQKIRDAGKAAKLEQEGHVIRSEQDAKSAINLKLDDIKQNPKEPKLYRDLGDLYIKIKEYDRAKEAYEKALEVNPADYFANEKLGDLQLKLFDDQIAAASNAYRLAPTPDNKAKVDEVRKTKLAFSVEEWGRRVQEHPTDAELRFRYGKFLHQAGQDDEAIANLQKTVHDPKVASEAHHILGLAFRKKGMYELSVKDLLKAREGLNIMNETNKSVTYDLARTYELLEKKEEAKAEYQRIAEADFSYKDVAKRLGALG
jgi:tetratricopeptide (TPR) repeat protein